MNIREKKTKRSITNAFLQLLKNKPLERITVKELAELAEISKATFYLHYRDIFDLSDSLQEEVIQNILSSISHPEEFLHNQTEFSFALCHAFYAQQSLIEILFSGAQSAVLPMRIEKELREYLHKHMPTAAEKRDMLLTYQILGSYYVFQQYHQKYGMETVIRFLGSASEAVGAFHKENI